MNVQTTSRVSFSPLVSSSPRAPPHCAAKRARARAFASTSLSAAEVQRLVQPSSPRALSAPSDYAYSAAAAAAAAAAASSPAAAAAGPSGPFCWPGSGPPCRRPGPAVARCPAAVRAAPPWTRRPSSFSLILNRASRPTPLLLLRLGELLAARVRLRLLGPASAAPSRTRAVSCPARSARAACEPPARSLDVRLDERHGAARSAATSSSDFAGAAASGASPRCRGGFGVGDVLEVVASAAGGGGVVRIFSSSSSAAAGEGASAPARACSRRGGRP